MVHDVLLEMPAVEACAFFFRAGYSGVGGIDASLGGLSRPVHRIERRPLHRNAGRAVHPR
jgi:hypothetical protein